MNQNLIQLIEVTKQKLLFRGEISFHNEASIWLPVIQKEVTASILKRDNEEQEELLTTAVHALVESQSEAWSSEDHPDLPWWWEHKIDFDGQIMESLYDADPRLRIRDMLCDVGIKRDKCLDELSSSADRQCELLEDLSSIEAERGELSDDLLRLEIEFVQVGTP